MNQDLRIAAAAKLARDIAQAENYLAGAMRDNHNARGLPEASDVAHIQAARQFMGLAQAKGGNSITAAKYEVMRLDKETEELKKPQEDSNSSTPSAE